MGRPLLLVVAWLALIVSVGEVIASTTHYLFLRSRLAAPPCADEFDASCALDQAVTARRVASCDGDACRLTVSAPSFRGRPFQGDVLVDQKVAASLTVGDVLTARLVSGEVMSLRKAEGGTITRWDSPERLRRSAEVIAAIFVPLAIGSLVWLIGAMRAARRRRTSGVQALPRPWGFYVGALFLVVGAGDLVVLPILYVARAAEARAYSAAPTCAPDTRRDDCRFLVDADVRNVDCRDQSYCAVTFHFDGAYGRAAAIANLPRDTRVRVGDRRSIEVFGGGVTQTMENGQMVAPHGVTGGAASYTLRLLGAAVMMTVCGGLGVWRYRRRKTA